MNLKEIINNFKTSVEIIKKNLIYLAPIYLKAILLILQLFFVFLIIKIYVLFIYKKKMFLNLIRIL